jgi:pimeloyl-ACP methyl ester carboxylesterase
MSGSPSVVHVGHSWGSVVSYFLAAEHPNNTDGIILTGYSQPPSAASYVSVVWAAFNMVGLY